MDDWDYLPENILGHTVTFSPAAHSDGRRCVWHQRLGKWCFDNDKECLRGHDFDTRDADWIDVSCAWSDYRKDYGVDEKHMDAAHKAFKAGWKAAKEGPQDGVLR